MKREFNRKTDEKGNERRAEVAETQPDDMTQDDIDPADFFDPEEFGYRRQPNPSRQ
jgi:hypothetical protein